MAKPAEPIKPTGVGPSNVLGWPCVINTLSAAMPLIAACPITAGHTLPERSVAQPSKIPRMTVNHTIISMPSHGAPGYPRP